MCMNEMNVYVCILYVVYSVWCYHIIPSVHPHQPSVSVLNLYFYSTTWSVGVELQPVLGAQNPLQPDHIGNHEFGYLIVSMEVNTCM